MIICSFLFFCMIINYLRQASRGCQPPDFFVVTKQETFDLPVRNAAGECPVCNRIRAFSIRRKTFFRSSPFAPRKPHNFHGAKGDHRRSIFRATTNQHPTPAGVTAISRVLSAATSPVCRLCEPDPGKVAAGLQGLSTAKYQDLFRRILLSRLSAAMLDVVE